ncbi:MAG: phosphatidate cytidylyltransferase [Selenomonadaceae bacterium]|nr:phosphatidate cytidylyltransferase [Selenomonadaceae bacterium]
MVLRIITGIIGIAISAVLIKIGGTPFAIAAILLALISWFEYCAIFQRAGVSTAYIVGAIPLVLMLCCAWLGNFEEILGALTLGTIAIFLLMVLFDLRPTDVCVSTAGLVYIGMPFVHLIMLRFLQDDRMPFESVDEIKILPDISNEVSALMTHVDLAHVQALFNIDMGCKLVWLLFLCTWASDTFAYFIGSAIGSHKIAPQISPNKTVEGIFGSIVGTVFTAAVVGNLLFAFDMKQMLMLGFVMAIAATLGDLAESTIKRAAGVKDSGFLIPGHGGVLDRFDSLFFTAPVFYYFAVITGLTA